MNHFGLKVLVVIFNRILKCQFNIIMNSQGLKTEIANREKRVKVANQKSKIHYVDVVYGKVWYDAGVSEKFHELSNLLLKRFSPNIIVKGQMVKKGGLFEIYVNGEKLFSKVMNESIYY